MTRRECDGLKSGNHEYLEKVNQMKGGGGWGLGVGGLCLGIGRFGFEQRTYSVGVSMFFPLLTYPSCMEHSAPVRLYFSVFLTVSLVIGVL